MNSKKKKKRINSHYKTSKTIKMYLLLHIDLTHFMPVYHFNRKPVNDSILMTSRLSVDVIFCLSQTFVSLK